MDRTVAQSLLFLDSASCENQSDPAECKWTLKRPIIAPLGTYLALSVRKFCCFISFDNVNRLNATFTANDTTTTIPDGMYSGPSLAQTINALGLDFTVTYDAQAHVFRAHVTDSTTFGDDDATAAWLRVMGWTEYAGATTHIDFVGHKVDLGGGFHSTHITTDLPLDTHCTRANATRNLLAVCPFNAGFGEMQVYQPHDQLAIAVHDRTLSTIRIRLETNRRNLIPLSPGSEWSLGLIVHTIFSPGISKARSLTPIDNGIGQEIPQDVRQTPPTGEESTEEDGEAR